MSLHKRPLTALELAGLKAHGLAHNFPFQLSDAFRLGVAWALASVPPQPSGDTMVPSKLVAVLSGGDWADASVTFVKVPVAMDIAAQKEKYDAWYNNEYKKTLGTPFQVSFMGFEAWLRNHGAVSVPDSEIEIFEDD